MSPRTLFRKIWDAHVVAENDDGPSLLYVDLHLVHEVTSPQAFESLRVAGRPVRRPDLTVATMDHNVPTLDGPITDTLARAQLDALQANCDDFGVRLFATGSGREGIVHVIGPELGLTQPGMTIVCGDSHTSTHGALGALAFGIGTSEVEHVLATQTLPQALPRTMKVEFVGELPFGLAAKDMVLAAIGQLGVSGRPRPRARVHGLTDSRAHAGGAPDRLQHVDRGRCACGPRRARRRHLRVPRGSPGRSGRRGLGARPRRVACARNRRGRRVRRYDDGRHLGAEAPGHVGHESRHGRAGRRRRSRPGRVRRIPTSARRSSGRSATWT